MALYSSAAKESCLLIRIALGWHVNELVAGLLLLEDLFLPNLVHILVLLQFLRALQRILGVQLVWHELCWRQILVRIWCSKAPFGNQLGHIGVVHGVVLFDMVAIPVHLGTLDVRIVQRIADLQFASFWYVRLPEDRVGA